MLIWIGAGSFIAVYQREEYVEDREIKNGMIGCIPALIGVLDMILGKIGGVIDAPPILLDLVI